MFDDEEIYEEEDTQEYLSCEDCGSTSFNVTVEGELECTFCGESHDLVEDSEYDFDEEEDFED